MIQALLSADLGNEDPQRQRRGVTTFAGLAEVAAQVGLNIKNLDWDGGGAALGRENLGACRSGLSKPAQITLIAAGIDPAGSDRFAVLLADPATVDMGRTRREDHELAPLSRLVVILPMKLGASVGHIVAIKNPGEHAMDRLSGLVANCPIAVPALETLTRGVALQIENRIYE